MPSLQIKEMNKDAISTALQDFNADEKVIVQIKKSVIMELKDYTTEQLKAELKRRVEEKKAQKAEENENALQRTKEDKNVQFLFERILSEESEKEVG